MTLLTLILITHYSHSISSYVSQSAITLTGPTINFTHKEKHQMALMPSGLSDWVAYDKDMLFGYIMGKVGSIVF